MATKININYVRKFELCDDNHFNIVKGISILAAVAANVARSYWNLAGLQFVSVVATAVFLFCSGYGVSESYFRKNGMVHYWENKMIKVWLPSLASIILTSLILYGDAIVWVSYSPLGLKGNALYFVFGGYAAFWIVLSFLEKSSVQLSALFILAIISFFFVPDEILYKQAVLAFPLGVMFSKLRLRRKVRMASVVGKTAIFLGLAVIAGASWFAATIVTTPMIQSLLGAVCYPAMGLALFFGVYFVRKISIFGIFVPFGMISYGIYLLYDGIFTIMMRDSKVSDWRMYAIVALVVCFAATILTVLRELLINWNRQLRRRKRPRLKGSM